MSGLLKILDSVAATIIGFERYGVTEICMPNEI